MGNPAPRCRRFAVPKRGHSAEEYEDAAAWDGAAGRYAVADGASESAFAGEWARLLCESFVGGSPDYGWVDEARVRWLAEVGARPMPWYLEEKIRDGSFATFVGLTIDAGASTWQSVAVGDSCLFQVRGDVLLSAFPVERPDHFGARPDLIGSRGHGPVNLVRAEGTLSAGDSVLLMSDALAQWFLTEHEAGRKPRTMLDALTDDSFTAWVDLLRTTRRLKNDDVTLLVIDPFSDSDGSAAP